MQESVLKKSASWRVSGFNRQADSIRSDYLSAKDLASILNAPATTMKAWVDTSSNRPSWLQRVLVEKIG